MPELTQAVFLSYASQDVEAAKRICEALRAAGIEVWFDQSELRGGDAWDRQIRRQIHDCKLFVPLISAQTQARLEGYFRREWKLAVDRTHDMADAMPFLVPVVIDDTTHHDAEVPDSFRAVQWSHLAGGETPPAFVDRILRLLSSPSHSCSSARISPSVSASNSRRVTPTHPMRLAWRWWPAVLLALAMGVGYFVLHEGFLSKRIAQPTVATAPATPASSTVALKSIAVLPFVDLSEKRDQEYFADGMAEEILNLLVKVPGLKVIGRTSSFQFKGKTDDLRQIGAVLSAAYVLEGSVRRSANHFRVTAQLIDTRDGVHRWSDTYDRDAADALRVQDEIAGSLVRALQVEVDPSTAFPSRSTPSSQETYDLYLRGLHAIDQFNEASFEEALVIFRRVLELDPSFVPAAEAFTETLIYLTGYGLIPREPGFQQLRDASAAALKLDANSAVAHAGLANVYEGDYEWTGAREEVTSALALAPNNPTVLLIAADEQLMVGQWAEAARLLDRLRAIDPLRPSAYEWSCWVYPMLGRLAEAESACRRALEISPKLVAGSFNLGQILLLQGKAAAALAEMQRSAEPATRLRGLALAYHVLHRNRESQDASARLEAQYAQDEPLAIAEIHAFRGENEQALAWLDRAYLHRDHDLVYIKSDLLLMNLQGSPRFKALLRKMKLPE